MKTDTRSPASREHLKKYQAAVWKALLDVQTPYRWNKCFLNNKSVSEWKTWRDG